MAGSDILKNVGVELERSSTNKFSAAIEDYGKQSGNGDAADSVSRAVKAGNIDVITGDLKNFGAGAASGEIYGKDSQIWQSSKYASDMIQYAPKNKFIFKVQFVFNEPYSRINREFMYVVKNIDKPKVQFEYDEVNMYNFKTKVLRTIRHDPLQMTFHDDIQNKVVDFFNAYRTAYSPISNMNLNNKSVFEEYGMHFEKPGNGRYYSASSGLLENDNKNLLSHIRVTQVYGHGSRENHFVFINPKIDTFDFDNMDQEDSLGNILSVGFNYDALYIEDELTTGTPNPRWGQTDIIGNEEVSSRRGLNSQFGGDHVPAGIDNPENYDDNDAFDESDSFDEYGLAADTDSAVSSSESTYSASASNTLSNLRTTVNQASAGITSNSIINKLRTS